MEGLLSNKNFKITNGDKIVYLNSLANKAKSKGQKVINATVGMLYDENGELSNISFVDDIIKNAPKEVKKYGSISGGKDFSDALYSWLFSNVTLDKINYYIMATFGATAALSLSIKNYCSSSQEVLVPSIRWSNYDTISKMAGCEVKEYNLFNGDDKLDIESIKHVVNESIKKHQRAYLLINDPCQNPTGYTLEINEWKELLSFLKEKSKEGPIVLLDDIAYLNYSESNYEKVFALFNEYIDENFMIHVTFSASKTLGIYGYRGGALIGLCKNKVDLDDFKVSCEGSARGIWSMPNSLTCRIISEIFKDPEKEKIVREDIKKYRLLLKERADLFFEECEMVGLVTYPYNGGFFVLIPCEEPDLICDKLIKKNVFAVPMSGGLRVALSSLSKKEIAGLAKIIKNVMR